MRQIVEGAWPRRFSTADTVLADDGDDLVPLDAAIIPDALRRIRRKPGL